MDVDHRQTDCGQVLGIVDGRNSAAAAGWLGARSHAWRDRIEIVAIDPSDPFKTRPPTP